MIKHISCVVTKDSTGNLVYVDGRTWEEAHVSDKDYDANLLKSIFKDGKMTREQSLSDIRNVLHNGEF